MRSRIVEWTWGILLILAGALFLTQNLGYLGTFSVQFWMLVTAGLSVLFFASYFVSGVRNWGWLFPALIFGATTLTIALAENGYDDPSIGAPILLSIGVPFIVAYFLDTQKNWWALIPAWVMVFLTLVTLLVDRVAGEWIGSLFLFAVALPFLIASTRGHSRTWALYVGLSLSALGVIPILTTIATGELIGAFVLFLIALPFFVVYIRSPRSWWALIPAGVLASIGAGLLLTSGILGMGDEGSWMPIIMFLGWAATFGVLWLRRTGHKTAWAIWPALGTLGVALILTSSDIGFDLIWPLALIGAGILFLFFGMRKGKVSQ
jgi:hypothetical protein